MLKYMNWGAEDNFENLISLHGHPSGQSLNIFSRIILYDTAIYKPPIVVFSSAGSLFLSPVPRVQSTIVERVLIIILSQDVMPPLLTINIGSTLEVMIQIGRNISCCVPARRCI